jgi:hypothetical protein
MNQVSSPMNYAGKPLPSNKRITSDANPCMISGLL